jgi:hypothetical protein
MRRWRYEDPSDIYEYTDDEIVSLYRERYEAKAKEINCNYKFNREQCIEEWVLVHWAWEVKD